MGIRFEFSLSQLENYKELQESLPSVRIALIQSSRPEQWAAMFLTDYKLLEDVKFINSQQRFINCHNALGMEGQELMPFLFAN